MEFPTPALLFFIWFLMTPAIRIGLWLFARDYSRPVRLVVAHGSTFLIMVVVSVFALSGSETARMAVMLAIAQGVFFAIDFFGIGTDRS